MTGPVGITLRDLTHADAATCARMADELGLHSVWMPEAPGDPDAAIRLAGLGLQTERIRLATGVVPAPLRHPVEQAMAIGALQDVTGERFILGLGSGNPRQYARLGIKALPPVTHLREYLEVLRAAMSGTPVSYTGRFFSLTGLQVRHDGVGPMHCPIYVAAHNPRMLRLAGELADGVLLNMISVEDTQRALEFVHAADRRIADPPLAAAYLLTCVADDRAEAEAAARVVVASFCASEAFRRRLANFGSEYAALAKDVGARVWADGPERLAERIPLEMARAIAIVCAPEELPSRLEPYRVAGVDLPILSVFPVPLRLRQPFPPLPASGTAEAVKHALRAVSGEATAHSTGR